ncbi:hypothetical protein [Flexivirga meconopsidis]|uniref:hypothetical protein n=1 Tax=Flexivirga meconopsidis TaxID=2977121 RepID=UPI00223FB421|nr:hypothetical protein [Flexivirga meconopsidis]
MTDSDPAATPVKRGVALSNRPFAVMLRAGLRASVWMLPLAAAGCWVFRGAEGGWSAALGAVIALVFFSGGLLLMDKMVGDNAHAMMAGALAIYLAQVIFLGIVIFGLSEASWLDGPAFAIGVIAVTLVWQAAQVVAFIRLRQPVYDEPTEPTS